jgi:hypothetical protein
MRMIQTAILAVALSTGATMAVAQETGADPSHTQSYWNMHRSTTGSAVVVEPGYGYAEPGYRYYEPGVSFGARVGGPYRAPGYYPGYYSNGFGFSVGTDGAGGFVDIQ